MYVTRVSFCALLLCLCAAVKLTDARLALKNIGYTAPNAVQEQAVKRLLERLFGFAGDQFEVNVVNRTANEKDYFLISASQLKNHTVLINGTAGYAIANGINYYLKNYLHGQFTWSGSNTALPDKLPIPEKEIKIFLNDEYRYYENVCTSSYSMVWWGWSRWQREIDWMALNGINMPLAFVGQEAIAAKTFVQFGCSEADIDKFFTGPAFLAWNRMGNIRGFGGPLSRTWIELQVLLQMQILKGMRDLGMTPVVPGFNGYVPRAFETLYPNATILRGSKWNNFPDQYSSPSFINPSDPLFAKVQTTFISEYNLVFGSSHIYNIDLYNEMTPTTNNPAELAQVSAGVLKGIRDADNDGIWLMQGWLFFNQKDFWTVERTKAFITGVPQGSMILLDLFSEQSPQFERLQGYFGVPFIWCMLHNYGGVSGFFGNLQWENDPVIQARKKYSNMIGIGLTPEGTGQNEIIYEFMSENSYRTQAENLTSWVSTFMRNRYGHSDPDIDNAWRLLVSSVYGLKDKSNRNHGHYIITERPSLSLKANTWYKPEDVYQASTFYKNASKSYPKFCDNHSFQYDLVDLTRQVSQLRIAEAYKGIMDAFNAKNESAFNSSATSMLNTFDYLDKALSTHEAFMVGPWLEAAINSSPDNSSQQLFEYNARNQLTLWGPNGEISDYAAKMWSGLVEDFYKPRWNLFIETLRTALKTNTIVDTNKLKQDLISQVEKPFTYSRKKYPTKPIGNICNLI